MLIIEKMRHKHKYIYIYIYIYIYEYRASTYTGIHGHLSEPLFNKLTSRISTIWIHSVK